MIKIAVTSILVFFFSFNCFASKKSSGKASPFEFRIHYGIQNSDTKAFDEKMESYSTGVPDTKSPNFTGADTTYQIDEVVVGLRIETFEFSDANYSRQLGISANIEKIDVELSGLRAGFLLGWRPLQTKDFFIGLMTHYMPISIIDYTLTAKNTTTNAVEVDKFEGVTNSSFGAGLETGVYVKDQFKIGLEGGYTVFSARAFTDKSKNEILDTNSNPVTMSFSGPYGKLIVGANF